MKTTVVIVSLITGIFLWGLGWFTPCYVAVRYTDLEGYPAYGVYRYGFICGDTWSSRSMAEGSCDCDPSKPARLGNNAG